MAMAHGGCVLRDGHHPTLIPHASRNPSMVMYVCAYHRQRRVVAVLFTGVRPRSNSRRRRACVRACMHACVRAPARARACVCMVYAAPLSGRRRAFQRRRKGRFHCLVGERHGRDFAAARPPATARRRQATSGAGGCCVLLARAPGLGFAEVLLAQRKSGGLAGRGAGPASVLRRFSSSRRESPRRKRKNTAKWR